MIQKFFAWVHTYERHLSAAAMVAGFVIDNIFFTRIDLLRTHLLFLGYLIVATASIVGLHYLEARAIAGTWPKWRSTLPLVTQFMFGGLWSGYVIFFTRSATLSASWPFLLVLGAIFVGNEILKDYHDRLVFNVVLYFFALYSYMIFAVPIVTHDIGTGTFLLSGVIAVALFSGFLYLLRRVGRERYLTSAWEIRFYSALVLIFLNVFYFTNILPPLPLALSASGIYHSVLHENQGYVAEKEREPWYRATFGLEPTLHVTLGETLTAYAAVFAPVDLNTTVTHRWEWYDPKAQKWIDVGDITYPITGGRESGYKGYSIKGNLSPGSWRVTILTADGRVLGRLNFTVAIVSASVQTKTIQL